MSDEQRARARSAGFSLIELMLAILVLALLSTLVYVTWEALLPRTRLNSALHHCPVRGLSGDVGRGIGGISIDNIGPVKATVGSVLPFYNISCVASKGQ